MSITRPSAENFARLLAMLDAYEITRPQAKELLWWMTRCDAGPDELAECLGMEVFSDEIVSGLVEFIIMDNAKLVNACLCGNAKAVDSLMGIIMKLGGSSVHPERARDILESQLSLIVLHGDTPPDRP